jgi:hypothetical protein
MFLKGGGVQTQRHNTLRVYAKDGSPSLAILTTNVPLDHLLKAEEERSPLGRPAGLKKVRLDFFSVSEPPPRKGFATPVLAMLTTLRVTPRGP